MVRMEVGLLLGRVVGKVDTLGDVALEALDGLCQERLLLLGDALQGVSGLLSAVGLCTISNAQSVIKGRNSTYSELNGDREEVAASRLGNSLTSRNAGKVDVAGLNEALLALDSPEDLLSESAKR